eukprot:5316812-Pleurochrysis_carterae.AAC.3
MLPSKSESMIVAICLAVLLALGYDYEQPRCSGKCILGRKWSTYTFFLGLGYFCVLVSSSSGWNVCLLVEEL